MYCPSSSERISSRVFALCPAGLKLACRASSIPCRGPFCLARARPSCLGACRGRVARRQGVFGQGAWYNEPCVVQRAARGKAKAGTVNLHHSRAALLPASAPGQVMGSCSALRRRASRCSASRSVLHENFRFHAPNCLRCAWRWCDAGRTSHKRHRTGV
jgi:hypothetical protein